MMKFLAVCISLLICSPLGAAPAFLVSRKGGEASCGSGFTTSAIDTTGATLIVIAVADFIFDPASDSVSDSNGNTWHHLTTANDLAGSGDLIVAWYAYDHGGSPLSVGSGHTFSVSGGNCTAANVFAFSGTLTSGNPFDVESAGGNFGGGTTCSAGTLSVTQDNDVVFAAATYRSFSSPGADSPLTNSLGLGYLEFGANVADPAAEQIQTTATPYSPSWTNGSGLNGGCLAASFKAAGGGGGSTAAPVQTGYGCCVRGGVLR